MVVYILELVLENLRNFCHQRPLDRRSRCIPNSFSTGSLSRTPLGAHDALQKDSFVGWGGNIPSLDHTPRYLRHFVLTLIVSGGHHIVIWWPPGL